MTASQYKGPSVVLVGVDLGDVKPDSSIPLFIGLVEPGRQPRRMVQRYIFDFDWVNDELTHKILDKISTEWPGLGGCHGWRVGYQSPDGGTFTIYEYDYDPPEYSLDECVNWKSNTRGDCGGRMEFVDGQIICENCRNKIDPPFRSEAEKRAEDWRD